MSDDFIKVEVTGIQATINTLDNIKDKMFNKWLRQGCRDGTKIIADDMKRNAPILTGAMARSVIVRAMKRKRGRVGYLAQYSSEKLKLRDGNFKVKNRLAYYPGYLEKGSAKTGLAAQRNAEKAYDRQKDNAFNAVAGRIEAELAKQNP